MELMGLKEKTVRFLSYSGTTKGISNWEIIVLSCSLLSDPLILVDFFFLQFKL